MSLLSPAGPLQCPAATLRLWQPPATRQSLPELLYRLFLLPRMPFRFAHQLEYIHGHPCHLVPLFFCLCGYLSPSLGAPAGPGLSLLIFVPHHSALGQEHSTCSLNVRAILLPTIAAPMWCSPGLSIPLPLFFHQLINKTEARRGEEAAPRPHCLEAEARGCCPLYRAMRRPRQPRSALLYGGCPSLGTSGFQPVCMTAQKTASAPQMALLFPLLKTALLSCSVSSPRDRLCLCGPTQHPAWGLLPRTSYWRACGTCVLHQAMLWDSREVALNGSPCGPSP